MKVKMIEYLVEQLRLHGLSFLLMGVAVHFLYAEYRDLSEEVKDCNASIIEHYRFQTTELTKVVEANTVVLEKLSKVHIDD